MRGRRQEPSEGVSEDKPRGLITYCATPKNIGNATDKGENGGGSERVGRRDPGERRCSAVQVMSDSRKSRSN